MRQFKSQNARAALFLGPGQPLRLIEAPIPSPIGGELLVDIECCAICSSDLHTQSGRRIEPAPTVLGHEIVGRIMRFGPDAVHVDARRQTLEIGDRITWTVAASCGHCRNCLDGLQQKCVKLIKYGHEKVSIEMPFRGGLAEVILLSAGTGIVKLPSTLPANMPLAALALANCSTATVAAALRAGFDRRNRPAMSVAVLGAGVLGLTACAMARHLYEASVVIAVDHDPSRAERAKAFGATHVCTDLALLDSVSRECTQDLGVDIAIELAGSIHTTRAAVTAVRTGGTIVLAGTTMPTDPLLIEPQSIVRRLLRIEGVHNYVTSDLVTAVDFLLSAAFPADQLIGAEYELAEIQRAFADGHHRPGRRVVIAPREGTL